MGVAVAIVVARAVLTATQAAFTARVAGDLDGVVEWRVRLRVVLGGARDGQPGLTQKVLANTDVRRSPVALAAAIRTPLACIFDCDAVVVEIVLSASGAAFVLVIVAGIRAGQIGGLVGLSVKRDNFVLGPYASQSMPFIT